MAPWTWKKLSWLGLFVLVSMVCVTVLANTRQTNSTDMVIPGSVVRTTLSSSERDYELRGVALSINGSMIELLIAARNKNRAEAESLVWASVDASGRILSEQDPLASLSSLDASRVNLHSPKIGNQFAFPRETGFLWLPMTNGEIQFLRLDRSRKPTLVTRKINSPSPISGESLTKNSEWLDVIAGNGAQPLVVGIDTHGQPAAEYLPRADGVVPIKVLFESNGGAMLIGEKGTFPNTTVWVGRVSPQGEIVGSASFPGRPKDMARGSDGNYVVLIERTTEKGAEVLIKAFSPTLGELWTQALISGQHLVPSFHIAPVVTGGFIVAGVKDRGLWISRVKANGTPVWTEEHPPLKSTELEMVSQVQLVFSKDVFVTAYSAFIVVGREQREVVRTVRFTAN